jgi:hypothetical protein
MHSRAAESGPMPGGPEVFQEQGVGRNSGRHDKACQKAADGQQQCAGSSSGGTMSPHGTRARWEEDGQSMCRAMGGAATSLHLSNQREGAQCIASAVAGCNCRMGAGEFEASATRAWYRELRGGGHLSNANTHTHTYTHTHMHMQSITFNYPYFQLVLDRSASRPAYR